MDIKKFFTSNEIYASSTRRGAAAMIDIWIVLFLRVIVMQLIGSLWLNDKMKDFMQEFQQTFNSDFDKANPQHIDFVLHHPMFYYALIFYSIIIFVGALYHAYLNSSAWNATIGKRLLKIMIIRQDNLPISLARGFAHYFSSVLPFVFFVYLLSYQARNGLDFSQALAANQLNIVIGILSVFWIQLHLFTKKKTTIYDLICKTFVINGKTDKKFPWSK